MAAFAVRRQYEVVRPWKTPAHHRRNKCEPCFSSSSSPRVVLYSAAPVDAQSTAATVSGSVLDEQKAALPGASVTIRNLESGQVRSATTDARGGFRVVGLPPGRYELAAELSSFGRFVNPNLVLSVAQEATVVVTLKIAALQEAITVTGEVPIVETSRSALGTTITTSEIEELPIAGRNFATLAQLTPGRHEHGGRRRFVVGTADAQHHLPGRRPEQRRRLGGRAARRVLGGRDQGVHRRRQQLRRGVRAVVRRDRERRHALGHQQPQRARLLLPP